MDFQGELKKENSVTDFLGPLYTQESHSRYFLYKILYHPPDSEVN